MSELYNRIKGRGQCSIQICQGSTNLHSVLAGGGIQLIQVPPGFCEPLLFVLTKVPGGVFRVLKKGFELLDRLFAVA